MKRLLLMTAILVIAVSAYLAAAAALGGVGSARVGAGNATVSRCDTDGFTVSYTVSSGNVTSVTVADMADPDCEAAEVRVTLTNASGASVRTGGPVTVPTDAGTFPNSVNVGVTSVAETTVVGIQISVIGP